MDSDSLQNTARQATDSVSHRSTASHASQGVSNWNTNRQTLGAMNSDSHQNTAGPALQPCESSTLHTHSITQHTHSITHHTTHPQHNTHTTMYNCNYSQLLVLCTSLVTTTHTYEECLYMCVLQLTIPPLHSHCCVPVREQWSESDLF